MTRPFASNNIVGLAFDHRQIGGFPDRRLHSGGVKPAIGLGARAAHRRTLAAIEHAKLDAAAVGDPAHQAVEGVDLADQMALPEPADGRIARHRADGRKSVGHQRRPGAHAGGGGRSLAAGVAAADDDDVEGFHELASNAAFYRRSIGGSKPLVSRETSFQRRVSRETKK